MSTKAPTPFGGASSSKASPGESVAAVTSSSSFPPMSSKAPTPFGLSAKTSAVKASSASSFPPLSKKAPTPFSAGSGTVSSFIGAKSSGSTDIVANIDQSSAGKSAVSSGKSSLQTSKVEEKAQKTSAPTNPFANFSFGSASAPQWPTAKPADSSTCDKSSSSSFGFSFTARSGAESSGVFGASAICTAGASSGAKIEESVSNAAEIATGDDFSISSLQASSSPESSYTCVSYDRPFSRPNGFVVAEAIRLAAATKSVPSGWRAVIESNIPKKDVKPAESKDHRTSADVSFGFPSYSIKLFHCL